MKEILRYDPRVVFNFGQQEDYMILTGWKILGIVVSWDFWFCYLMLRGF